MFTKCLSSFLKGFILEEKCIDWKANFILNGFLLNKWRDDQKGGWQNVLKTNRQNVRDFLHIALLNPRRTEVNNINHFAWVWAWLEMNLEPVIQGFPFWKKKCWCILEWFTELCAWPWRGHFVYFDALHMDGKVVMTLKSILWLSVDESFIYTSSNKVSFLTLLAQAQCWLMLVGESLSSQCPALGHITATK